MAEVVADGLVLLEAASSLAAAAVEAGSCGCSCGESWWWLGCDCGRCLDCGQSWWLWLRLWLKLLVASP